MCSRLLAQNTPENGVNGIFCLPQEGCINLKTAIQVTSLSRSNILRKIKERRFPVPFHYGGILLFSVADIREFIKNPAIYGLETAGALS